VSGIPAEIALHIYDVVMERVMRPTWDVVATRALLVGAVEDGFIEAGEAKRILRGDRRPQMIAPSSIGMDRIAHRWNLHKTRLPVDPWPDGVRPRRNPVSQVPVSVGPLVRIIPSEAFERASTTSAKHRPGQGGAFRVVAPNSPPTT
jgi:hypothetical protein